MLKQRVITAVVLLGVLALVVAATSPWPFLLFLALACACAGFEWLRLTLGLRSVWAPLGALALFSVCAWQAKQWIGGDFKASALIASHQNRRQIPLQEDHGRKGCLVKLRQRPLHHFRLKAALLRRTAKQGWRKPSLHQRQPMHGSHGVDGDTVKLAQNP